MRRYWTTHDVRRLRELYPDTVTAAIGRVLGRTKYAVKIKAQHLGLRKSPAFTAAHCYQQGHAPWNTGKAWNPHGSRATQFKKGQRGIRQRPVGAERTLKDGTVEVKIGEPKVWRIKARWVWEQHFGPIPRGMIVRMKEKNNFEPENLTLLTRAENARIVSRTRKPKRKPVVRWVMALGIHA